MPYYKKQEKKLNRLTELNLVAEVYYNVNVTVLLSHEMRTRTTTDSGVPRLLSSPPLPHSFGLTPAQPLQVQAPLQPNFPADVSLQLATNGPVQKMDPLTNLQVAIKNNVDVFYFSCLVPLHVLCAEDGLMDKRVFLATWKDIPAQNELQFALDAGPLTADQLAQRLQHNNVFTIAKRNVDGQDMLYQSLRLTNGIWVLAELKCQPGNPRITVSRRCRTGTYDTGYTYVFEVGSFQSGRGWDVYGHDTIQYRVYIQVRSWQLPEWPRLGHIRT